MIEIVLFSALSLIVGMVLGHKFFRFQQKQLPTLMPLGLSRLLPSKTSLPEKNRIAQELIALIEVDGPGWTYKYTADEKKWDYFKHDEADISLARLGNRLWMTNPISIEFEGLILDELHKAMREWAASKIAGHSTKLLTE